MKNKDKTKKQLLRRQRRLVKDRFFNSRMVCVFQMGLKEADTELKEIDKLLVKQEGAV